jgi:uncharacterized protein YbcV (DUF1398 family)
MSAPHIHAISSAKKFGGKMEDYMEIHAKMDCSKGYVADNRHRVLTHTMFWVKEVMIPLYGEVITNSDGKIVSVKDVCEQHILEDYRQKFIPTPQDFIENMEFKDWMQNARTGVPNSARLLYKDKDENHEHKLLD